MRAVTLHRINRTSLFQSLLVVIALVVAVANPLYSQTLRGQVVDSVSAEPLDRLEVVLLNVQRDTVAVTRSGSDGRFAVNIPAGEYTLCVRCIGHRPKQVSVEVPSDTAVIVRLAEISTWPDL